MLSGMRALKDYQTKEASAKAISATLCAKEDEITEAVSHLKEEQVSLKNEIAALKQSMLTYRATEIDVSAPMVVVFDAELGGNEPRELMNLLLEKGAGICAIFAGTDETGYRYVIGSHKNDVRPYSKVLKEKLSGRGGGKPEMIQGSVQATEEAIREVIAEV